MGLSVLDQTPVISGHTPAQAVRETIIGRRGSTWIHERLPERLTS